MWKPFKAFFIYKVMSKNQKLDWDEAKEIADVLTKTENPDEDYSITEKLLPRRRKGS